MMDRRRVLQIAGVAGVGAVGGCLSVQVGSSAPVDLEIWNDTQASHSVDVTVRDGDDEIVLDEIYEIDTPESSTTPGGPVVTETGFTEATPEERFDVVAILDGDLRYEPQFRATCVNEDTPEEFLITIDPGRETSLQFDQSSCS